MVLNDLMQPAIRVPVITGVALFLFLLFGGIRVMRIRRRRLFVAILTLFFWFPFTGVIFITTSALTGNRHLQEGEYQLARAYYNQFYPVVNLLPEHRLSTTLISKDQMALYRKRYLIALYHSGEYKQFKGLLGEDFIQKERVDDQPFWMLYLANSCWHTGDPGRGVNWFYRSYLMALSVLSPEVLEHYETYLNTTSTFKEMVVY